MLPKEGMGGLISRGLLACLPACLANLPTTPRNLLACLLPLLPAHLYELGFQVLPAQQAHVLVHHLQQQQGERSNADRLQ